MRSCAPSILQGRYAGTRPFKCQGMAQGRRGHRRPPDRFARPPSHGQAGRLSVQKRFLFHRSGGDFVSA